MEQLKFATEYRDPAPFLERPTDRALHSVERAVFDKFDQFRDRVETLTPAEEGAAMSYRLNLTDEESLHNFSAQILTDKNGYVAASLSGRYVTELAGARLFSDDSVYVDRGGIWLYDSWDRDFVPVANQKRFAMHALHRVAKPVKAVGREIAHRVETAHAA